MLRCPNCTAQHACTTQIASKPRLSTARVAAAALAALLSASPAHANLPFATAFGRPARPERPGRPARPERPARPARPGRPGRLTNATAPDEVALPPEPAEPVIEIPESALPVAPPTDVAGGAVAVSVHMHACLYRVYASSTASVHVYMCCVPGIHLQRVAIRVVVAGTHISGPWAGPPSDVHECASCMHELAGLAPVCVVPD